MECFGFESSGLPDNPGRLMARFHAKNAMNYC
jgi:hypothetical protein